MPNQTINQCTKAPTTTLAKSITESLISNMKEKGNAKILLSGGKTPIPLLWELSTQKIPWQTIQIHLNDERVNTVSPEETNSHMVKKYLSRNLDQGASLICPELDLSPSNCGDTQFDVGIIGFGKDGHVASIFEGDPKFNTLLDTNKEPGYHLTPCLGEPKVPRITMNMSMILNTKHIIIIHREYDKCSVISNAVNKHKFTPISCVYAASKLGRTGNFGSFDLTNGNSE